LKIIILAAGYAVRLQPLTLSTSKSLLPIAGRKIIDRIMEKVSALKGVGAIYIISNAKFFGNFQDWHRRLAKDREKISLINDGTMTNETRLGAIKDLDFAISRKAIGEDLLVVAGDNLFEFDLNDFLKFAHEHSDGVSLALYDIKSLELARNFGVLKIDDKSRVIDFEEKPANPESTLISTGIYYFPKDKVPFIKEYVKCKDKLDAPGYYIRWLSKNHKVYGFKFLEDWHDIGTIESYEKADREYLKKEKGKYD